MGGDDFPDRHNVRARHSEADAPAVQRDVDGNEVIPPFPWREMCIVLLVTSCDSIAFTQVFPYLGYYIIYLGMATDERTVGRYAGYLAGIYSIMQFISAPIWGWVSDRVGRRPTLLVGLFGTLVSTLMFGFAEEFTFAITARALWGLLNGNLGVAKCYISERTHESHQTKAWSAFSASASVGRILGPAIGGYLAEPVKTLPFMFSPTGLFGRFPYLLPSLVSACLTVVGLIMGYFFLVETLDPRFIVDIWTLCGCKKRRAFAALPQSTPSVPETDRASKSPARKPSAKRTSQLPAGAYERVAVLSGDSDGGSDSDCDSGHGMVAVGIADAGLVSGSVAPDTGSSKSPRTRHNPTGAAHVPQTTSTSPAIDAKAGLGGTESHAEAQEPYGADAAVMDDDEEGHIEEARLLGDSNRGASGKVVSFRSQPTVLESTALEAEEDNNDDVAAPVGYGAELNAERELSTPTLVKSAETEHLVLIAGDSSQGAGAQPPSKRATFCQLLCDKNVLVASLLYGLLGFGQAMFQEVLPIWSINKRENGGIGFGSASIGLLNMSSGVLLVVCQTLLYPRLAKRYGPLVLFRVMLAVLSIVFGMAPWVTLVAANRVSVWVAMVADLGLQVVVSQIAYTCTFQIIRVSTSAENLGVANGISQSFVALARAVGPALGSVLLAWSLTNGLPFPLDFHFVFLLCTGITLVPIALSYLLGPEFNRA